MQFLLRIYFAVMTSIFTFCFVCFVYFYIPVALGDVLVCCALVAHVPPYVFAFKCAKSSLALTCSFLPRLHVYLPLPLVYRYFTTTTATATTAVHILSSRLQRGQGRKGRKRNGEVFLILLDFSSWAPAWNFGRYRVYGAGGAGTPPAERGRGPNGSRSPRVRCGEAKQGLARLSKAWRGLARLGERGGGEGGSGSCTFSWRTRYHTSFIWTSR